MFEVIHHSETLQQKLGVDSPKPTAVAEACVVSERRLQKVCYMRFALPGWLRHRRWRTKMKLEPRLDFSALGADACRSDMMLLLNMLKLVFPDGARSGCDHRWGPPSLRRLAKRQEVRSVWQSWCEVDLSCRKKSMLFWRYQLPSWRQNLKAAAAHAHGQCGRVERCLLTWNRAQFCWPHRHEGRWTCWSLPCCSIAPEVEVCAPPPARQRGQRIYLNILYIYIFFEPSQQQNTWNIKKKQTHAWKKYTPPKHFEPQKCRWMEDVFPFHLFGGDFQVPAMSFQAGRISLSASLCLSLQEL